MIEINFEPHTGQQEILPKLKRFNVLQCGRRFGKTVLMIWIMLKSITRGYPCAWYSPTYKDLNEVWAVFNRALFPVIKKKSEQLKQLTLVNGTVIDFWSFDDPDSGRGRKYGLVVIDECEKGRHFLKCWQATIRPALSDYKGSCYFISTPKLGKTDFKDLGEFARDENNIDWAFFQLPTYKNPFIDKDEIDSARDVLSTHDFACEYLAADTDLPSGHLFAWAFDEDTMVGDFDFDTTLPIDISFDFNNAPCTATISQQDGNRTWKRFLREIRIGTIDDGASIHDVCDRIKQIVPDGSFIRVTGDGTGHNRSAYVRGNVHAYDIIQEQLNIYNDEQIWTPLSNPSHLNSYFSFNEVLKSKNVMFDRSMMYTLQDLKLVEYRSGQILKKEAEKKGLGHLLDCVRYDIETFMNYD